jgi:hypothetical protein
MFEVLSAGILLDNTDSVIEIDYRLLDTLSLDEFKLVLWEDIQALHDEFGVSFVKGAKLIVPATNQNGDPQIVTRLSKLQGDS